MLFSYVVIKKLKAFVFSEQRPQALVPSLPLELLLVQEWRLDELVRQVASFVFVCLFVFWGGRVGGLCLRLHVAEGYYWRKVCVKLFSQVNVSPLHWETLTMFGSCNFEVCVCNPYCCCCDHLDDWIPDACKHASGKFGVFKIFYIAHYFVCSPSSNSFLWSFGSSVDSFLFFFFLFWAWSISKEEG